MAEAIKDNVTATHTSAFLFCFSWRANLILSIAQEDERYFFYNDFSPWCLIFAVIRCLLSCCAVSLWIAVKCFCISTEASIPGWMLNTCIFIIWAASWFGDFKGAGMVLRQLKLFTKLVMR